MSTRPKPTNDAVTETLVACAILARAPPSNRDLFVKLMYEQVWPLWHRAAARKDAGPARILRDLERIEKHTLGALEAVRTADAATKDFVEAQLGESLAEHASWLTERLAEAAYLSTIAKPKRGRESRHSSRRGQVRFHDLAEEFAANLYRITLSVGGRLTVNKNADVYDLAPGTFRTVLVHLIPILPHGVITDDKPPLAALHRIKSIVDGKPRKVG